MANKRFYWLKLNENFFDDDTISWIEEQENGKEYCLFYLKLCLKSLKTGGLLIRNVGELLIPYDIKKLAEITQTDFDTAIVAMELFKKIGLVQILENGEIYLTQLAEMVGSETDKAKAMREKRARDRAAVGNNVTAMLLDIEKEKDIDTDTKKENKGKAARFTPPTLEEVQAYISENNFSVDAARFVDYYAANGWQVGKSKMKDWRATVRNWNRREKESKPQQSKQQKSVEIWDADSLPF